MPVFAAQADGLFADRNLDVEIIDVPPGPVGTNVDKVATGDVDFCTTSVNYFLFARQRAGAEFSARFVAATHQRHPLTAVVHDDLPATQIQDLAGRPYAHLTNTAWFGHEYRAALIDAGVEPGPAVTDPGEAKDALASGVIEVFPRNANAVSRIRIVKGAPVRGIPVGPRVYGTGVATGDHVAGEVVRRMVEALVEGFLRERTDPELGLEALCRRYPATDPVIALEQWRYMEDQYFTGVAPCSMSEEAWERTVAWYSRANSLPRIESRSVYRREMTGVGQVVENLAPSASPSW